MAKPWITRTALKGQGSRLEVSRLHGKLIRPILRDLKREGVTEQMITSLTKAEQNRLHNYVIGAKDAQASVKAKIIRQLLETWRGKTQTQKK